MLSFFFGACALGLPYPEYDTSGSIPSLEQKNLADADLTLKFVPFEDVPGWATADIAGFLPTFFRSCETLTGTSLDRPMGEHKAFGTVGDWMSICQELADRQGAPPTTLRYYFESRLRPYLVGNREETVGLFTGYFEAELFGSWQPGGEYNVPIHARPDDIVSVDLGTFRPEWAGETIAGKIEGDTFVPYPDRAAITDGALNGQQLEMMWVNSHVDAFFLHIQGSGRVRMTDGSIVRLAYAGRNGHRYFPVGRQLIAAGIVAAEDMSMQAIRAWMESYPVASIGLMNMNPSYVFFRIADGDETAPVGAQGVPLTPGRSIAVDDDYLPYGLPMWLDSLDPRDPKRDRPLQRLVVPQDTGSAIRGPVRGDLFWGFGREAEAAAGVMKEPGSYYVFLPRTRDAITDEVLQ